MKRKSPSNSARVTRRTFNAGVGAAAIIAGTAPFNIVRAQAARSKSACCCRAPACRPASARIASAASISPTASSRASACRSSQIMNGDTETNVEVARSRAEKLIGEGAQLLVGAFDSGQTTAIAQVAEQKGIPYVINIAAAPPITEQGYKFVFRNFPTAPMILGDAFVNQKEVFAARRRGAEDGGVHARQRHLRHRDAEAASAR